MSTDERKVYKIIYYGLKSRTYNIVVPSFLPVDTIQEIYLRVLYDTPLFYYVNQTVIRMQGSLGNWVLLPEYLYTQNEIKQIDKELKSIVNKIKKKADQFKNNEFRLEKCLHDSVVKSVAYDYESLKKSDCFNAHSIVGAFIDRKAVCEGIAKAFKLLCNEYGIKCIIVLGKANKDGIFEDDDYHAWNLVKIANDSYYVDVTWDNLYDKEYRHISYDYFNVTTDDILLDHQPIGELPICNATRLNYFYCTNSFVNTYNELTSLIDQRFSSKEITFKVPRENELFSDFDDLKRKVITALLCAMLKKGSIKEFGLMFNEKHNICKILFLSTPKKKIDLRKHTK